MIRKILAAGAISVATFLTSLPAHAVPRIAVTVSDGSLQPGTTAGFNVSSGTIVNATIGQLSVTTLTVTGNLNINIPSGLSISSLTVTTTGVISGSTITATATVVNGTIQWNSTGTYTANQRFKNGISVSTGPTLAAVFDVGATSISATGLPLYARGTQTNDDAPTGCYGEYVSTTAASFTNFVASGTYQNFLSFTLQPGDWDLSAQMQLNTVGATTITQFNVAISSYSGNTTTDHVWGKNWMLQTQTYGASQTYPFAINNYRVSIAQATTFYWKATAESYTSGTPNMRVGYMRARRIR